MDSRKSFERAARLVVSLLLVYGWSSILIFGAAPVIISTTTGATVLTVIATARSSSRYEILMSALGLIVLGHLASIVREYSVAVRIAIVVSLVVVLAQAVALARKSCAEDQLN